jgi:hypothetical protein
MAFRPQDLCKTTRRASGNGLPRLFPRILGDNRPDPRLGIALRYFETHLGRPRREFDAEALITLFGDPRLARGFIRCLSRASCYRTRPLSDVLGREHAATLAERGLTTPAHLRALAYACANRNGGFVAPQQRAAFLGDLIDGLHPPEIERALWLDAPDQAVLVRDGPLPTAADIRSCYNVQVLETLLCSAPESHFALRGDRRLVEAVAARHAVQVSVDTTTVTLHGRLDAFGSWARHGVRVARGLGTPGRWRPRARHGGRSAGRSAVRGAARRGPAAQGAAPGRLGGSGGGMGGGQHGRGYHSDPAPPRPVGGVAAALVARALDGCPEDEVGVRLTPAADTTGDLVYIDGFGLSTVILLGQARAIIHEEMSGNGARLDLARIGRRLRGLVGRNEGLHALIAYLSGELRPAD